MNASEESIEIPKVALASWNFEEVSTFLCLGLFVLLVLLMNYWAHIRSNSPHIRLTPTLFFNILLPPVVLESAYSLFNRTFADFFAPIMLFAVMGTVLNFVLIGFGTFGVDALVGLGEPLIGLSIKGHLLFASLIVAVDPVAVLAIFQDIGVDAGLYYMVFEQIFVKDIFIGIGSFFTTFRLGWSAPSDSHELYRIYAPLEVIMLRNAVEQISSICEAVIFLLLGLELESRDLITSKNAMRHDQKIVNVYEKFALAFHTEAIEDRKKLGEMEEKDNSMQTSGDAVVEPITRPRPRLRRFFSSPFETLDDMERSKFFGPSVKLNMPYQVRRRVNVASMYQGEDSDVFSAHRNIYHEANDAHFAQFSRGQERLLEALDERIRDCSRSRAQIKNTRAMSVDSAISSPESSAKHRSRKRYLRPHTEAPGYRKRSPIPPRENEKLLHRNDADHYFARNPKSPKTLTPTTEI
ncbi:Sodium/hydrogen exchanger 3 [Taenia crassiceps]|uniref:Sodium/hydrogen exchanger 3 n=1 Tax=Taenia crassiceps TaxID=6207 RepID=A0ABR4Q7R7_9CEST